MTFPTLRGDAEKSAAAIAEAGKRKAPREEVCPLFKAFAAKEAKVIKFLVAHQKACGVPPQAVTQAKQNHAKTLQISKVVCSGGPGPAGPSLSDALGSPVVSEDSSKHFGGGTFETLTGNVMSR
jgi:hypothetical protein